MCVLALFHTYFKLLILLQVEDTKPYFLTKLFHISIDLMSIIHLTFKKVFMKRIFRAKINAVLRRKYSKKRTLKKIVRAIKIFKLFSSQCSLYIRSGELHLEAGHKYEISI